MGWNPKMSSGEIAKTAAEAVEYANVLNPHLPTPQLAEKTGDGSRSRFNRGTEPQLARRLLRALFERLIRAERRKFALQQHKQFELFEHLPLRIVGYRNRRIGLRDATYRDLERYCRVLRRRRRDRDRNDAQLKEAEALAEKLHAASKAHRGITVGELLGL
jgi:hypothetical protein